MLPHVLHNIAAIVQEHPFPNLIEYRPCDRCLHALVRLHILLQLVADRIGLQQELAAPHCLYLLLSREAILPHADVFLQDHQLGSSLAGEKGLVVLDPSLLDLSNCIFLTHLAGYLQETANRPLDFGNIALVQLPFLCELAPLVVGFDESRCGHDVLGAIGEEVVEEVLRAHLEEQFFLPELVLKGIVDEMVGDEFDGDVLSVEGGDLALAHGDEGGQVALEDAVLEVELGVVLPDVVGVLAHLDGVEDAEVLDLVVADLVHEGEALLHLVGLYAADEVQVGVAGHLADEVSHLLADLDP